MNDLKIHDPFALEPVDDLFRGLMRSWRADAGEGSPQIRLDVQETEADYLVKAEVPGVRREDIDVRVDGNIVSISAELKKDKEEKKDGRVLRSERRYGYASRSFTLASDVDDTKAAARYKDGVLELTLPKRARASSKRLAID